MKLMKNMMMVASAVLVTAPMAAMSPAMAQESSYKPGTIWEAGGINVLPGQFENYMDYLAGPWKKIQEFLKSEGIVVDYHVLSSSNPRKGEANLVLVIEYKDYSTTAEREAINDKINTYLAADNREGDAAYGKRSTMREVLSSTAYQELDLK